MSAKMPGVASWMTEERAAEVANYCNEGDSGILRKHELVEAVKFWALKCSYLAGEKAQLQHVAKFEDLVKRMEDAAKQLNPPPPLTSQH